MSKSLTTEEVRALLARAVEEKGEDYTYRQEFGPSCDYFRDGAPSCIVGHVLSYVGFTADDLKSHEGLSAGVAIHGLQLDLPERAVTALREAQEMQDNGATWGEALARFDRELGR